MATVLITGCSTGFGKLAALHFARKGATVYATMRDTSKGSDLLEAKETEGLAIELLELDVTDDASVKEAVAEAGQIDVLVNNAGFGTHGPIEETDDDEAKAVFETNVFGVLRMLRAVLPHMRERKAGTVVNVSSLAGVVAPPFEGIYAASKWALEALTEALHYEVHPFGIRVVLIEPGAFATSFRNSRGEARRYGEGSPYAELDQRFDEALSKLPGRAERADPQLVAEKVYDAVNDPEPKMRYLVGQDAEMIGALRHQMDDQQFEHTVRQALDFWD